MRPGLAAGQMLGAVVAVLTVTAALPFAAGATLPGRNGDIAFGIVDEVDSDAGVFYEGFYIGAMDPTGRNQRRIGARLGLDAVDPAFSPKGRFLAVSWYDSPRPGLLVTRPNGRPVTRLTYSQDSSPTWSPDGRRIAFDRRRCEPEGDECQSLGIYTIARDGTDRRRLTTAGVGPSWSAKGEIVFASDPFPLEFSSPVGRIMVTDPGGPKFATSGSGGSRRTGHPMGDESCL